MLLRRRQGLEHRVVDVREQVNDCAEREARLEFGRTAGKDVVGLVMRREEP